jgi:TolB-like protein
VTPSIAVLPFTNMSREEESEFLSDGITEDIINSPSRVEELKVAGRSMVFQFKGQNLTARQVGEKLKVGWVMEDIFDTQDEIAQAIVEREYPLHSRSF